MSKTSAPATEQYLVSTKWRGSLHVAPMRLFTDLAQAQAYGRSIGYAPQDYSDVFIYQLFPDKEPILLKVPVPKQRGARSNE